MSAGYRLGLAATGNIGAWRPSLLAVIIGSVIPAFALSLTTRWPAAVMVTGAGAFAVVTQMLDGPLDPIGHRMTIITLERAIVIAGLAWGLAARGDGRRALSPAAVVVVQSVLVGSAHLAGSPEAAPAHILVLLGVPVVGLGLVAFDPRPAIAATTIWCILFVTLIPTLLIVGPGLNRETPVVALVAVLVIAAGLILSRFGARRLIADVRA